MSTQLGSIVNSAGINVSRLCKRIGMPFDEVIKVLDGDKIPTPHSLKTIMHGIAFYTGRSFTDDQAVELLSESPGSTFANMHKKPSMLDQLAEDAARRRADRW